MKNHLYLTKYCISEIKQFYKDERGAYTIITGTMGAILLGLIALAVDGSGILLDKARLSQGMEQAAIALVTENNMLGNKGVGRKYSELTSIAVTDEEIKALVEGGNISSSVNKEEQKLNAQRYKRDHALAHGIVSSYMRSYDPSLSASQKWVTIKNDFDIKCNRQEVIQNNARNSVTVCRVDGEVDRKSWLPLTDNPLTFDKEEKLTTQRYYATKRDSVLIPLDVMLVSDFSGSMNDSIENRPPTKLETLKEVIQEIERLILRGVSASESLEVSPYNRMGFAAFAEGAAQHDGKNVCISPYAGKAGLQRITVSKEIFDKIKSEYSDVSGSIGSCSSETCTPTVPLSRILIKAFSIDDSKLIEVLFRQYFDPAKTVSEISSFDGNVRNYDLKYQFSKYCLEGNERRGKTTQAWFTQANPNISREVNNLIAVGGTGSSSGVLIGSNILMGINPDPESAPNKVGTNTQRVLLILSDGQDNYPDGIVGPDLINAGMCQAIQKRAEELQDPNYTKLPLRMGFVAFGYDPRDAVKIFIRTNGFDGDVYPNRLTTLRLQRAWKNAKEAVLQSQAWLKCMGADNYYVANSKAELLDAFKQIIGKKDEVGRTTNPSSITDF